MSETRESRRLTLGLEPGTPPGKDDAVGVDDAVVGEGAAGFGTDCTLPQQAEQQPADWLHAAAAAMRTLGDDLQGLLGADWADHVAAIGLTGQLPTLVCLGEAAPLG